jgi:hypothetical protein
MKSRLFAPVAFIATLLALPSRALPPRRVMDSRTVGISSGRTAFPVKGQDGTFLCESPGGKQPVIQQRPCDAGSHTAWTWGGLKGTTDDDVADAPPAAPARSAQGKSARPAEPANPNRPAPGTTPAAPDGAPLTENDIKKFFLDRIPGKWSDDPEKPLQVKAELDNLIKKRGTGSATISKDGTYRWDTKSAQGVIQGKWHAANADEMGDQGGAGVVLEGAKNGEPWVAFKYRASNPGEEWLGLAEVNRRSIREGAQRVPAGK